LTPAGGTGVHLYDMDVATSTPSDLGAIPGDPTLMSALASADGVVVQVQPATSPVSAQTLLYVSFATPGSFIQLGTNVPIVNSPVIDSDSVAWIENTSAYVNGGVNEDEAQTVVVRMNLDGSDETRVSVPYATSVAITPGFTGFFVSPTYKDISFETMPAAGGTITTFPTTPASYDLRSVGSAFVIDLPGTPASAGIYSVASAAGVTIHIAAAGAAPLRANAISLSAGRVVWADNGVGGGLWNRSISINGATITADDPQNITPETAQFASASGDRTAWITGDPQFPDTESLDVSNGLGGVLNLGGAPMDDRLTLSGTRVLENVEDGTAVLHDLVTGTSTTLPAPSQGNPNLSGPLYALWGNELAWVEGDGSVWFKDLATGSTTEVADPIADASETVTGTISVAAGIVAWNEYVCDAPTGFLGECVGQALHVRNVRTMAAAVVVAGAYPVEIEMSNGYIAYDGYDSEIGSLVLNVSSTTDPSVLQLGPLITGESDTFSVSPTMIGWVAADGLPHVQLLPEIEGNPWYLGNGIAPASMLADGTNSWSADFVVSQPLTACAVTITADEIAVRSLPCDPTQAQVGEAKVSWDGRDASGHLVAPGSYTWTLTGAQSVSPLLDADGTSAAITGTIDVTAVAPSGGTTTGGNTTPSTPVVVKPTSTGTLVGRVAGSDRFGTAIAASQAEFPGGGAGAVVLARADDYADALVGAPLAAAKDAPLLLTSGDSLPAGTKAELARVIGAGETVYLLGGDSAIPASVEAELHTLGYQTVRLAGTDRYATAVAVADALGDPGTVLLATGVNYPDALAAGPAAAHANGVVLLSDGATMPAETAAYLAAHAKSTYAVGGPAAAADPGASPITGADRYATAVAVATTFFATPTAVGVTTGQGFPDALAAGALLSHLGAPLVLTGSTTLPTATANYLASIEGSVTAADVFGGYSAVDNSVQTDVGTSLEP
jgi:hypothetical protein